MRTVIPFRHRQKYARDSSGEDRQKTVISVFKKLIPSAYFFRFDSVIKQIGISVDYVTLITNNVIFISDGCLVLEEISLGDADNVCDIRFVFLDVSVTFGKGRYKKTRKQIPASISEKGKIPVMLPKIPPRFL